MASPSETTRTGESSSDIPFDFPFNIEDTSHAPSSDDKWMVLADQMFDQYASHRDPGIQSQIITNKKKTARKPTINDTLNIEGVGEHAFPYAIQLFKAETMPLFDHILLNNTDTLNHLVDTFRVVLRRGPPSSPTVIDVSKSFEEIQLIRQGVLGTDPTTLDEGASLSPTLQPLNSSSLNSLTVLKTLMSNSTSSLQKWMDSFRVLSGSSPDPSHRENALIEINGIVLAVDDAMELSGLEQSMLELIAHLLMNQMFALCLRFNLIRSADDLSRALYIGEIIPHFCSPSSHGLLSINAGFWEALISLDVSLVFSDPNTYLKPLVDTVIEALDVHRVPPLDEDSNRPMQLMNTMDHLIMVVQCAIEHHEMHEGGSGLLFPARCFLGIAHGAKYELYGDAFDLDRCISVLQRARSSSQTHKVEIPWYLLLSCFKLRYQATRNPADLTLAIQLAEELIQQSHLGSKSWLIVVPLALALLERANVTQEASDYKRVVSLCFEQLPSFGQTTSHSLMLRCAGASAIWSLCCDDQLEAPIVEQALTFFDRCTQNDGPITQGADGAKSCAKMEINRRKLHGLLALILCKLLKNAAVAGDTDGLGFDPVLERLQAGKVSCGKDHMWAAFGISRHPVDSANARGQLDACISTLKQRVDSQQFGKDHQVLIAFLLAIALKTKYQLAPTLAQFEGDSREVFDYFLYFMNHQQPSEIPRWAVPTCQVFVESARSLGSKWGGGALTRGSIVEAWESRNRDNSGKEADNTGRGLGETKGSKEVDNSTAKSRAPQHDLGDLSSIPPHLIPRIWLAKMHETCDRDGRLDASYLDQVDRCYAECVKFLDDDEEAGATLRSVINCLWATAPAFQYHQTGFLDPTRLLSSLDILTGIIWVQGRVHPAVRVRTVYCWLGLGSLIWMAPPHQWSKETLVLAQELFNYHLSSMFDVLWSSLEEMSWLASSVWESIVDRQNWRVCDRLLVVTIHSHNAQFTIEALERWSGMIWTQLEQLRAPLDYLAEAGSPELANQLRTILDTLEKQWVQVDDDNQRGMVMRVYEKSNFELLQERNKMIKEIRAIKGFETWFQRRSIRDLTQASREGPVVLLADNVGSSLGNIKFIHAFILFPGSDAGGYRVDLPFTLKDLEELRESLTELAKTRPGCDGGDCDSFEHSCPECAGEQSRPGRVGITSHKSKVAPMVRLLAKLWDTVAMPILDVLMKYFGGHVDREDDGQGKPTPEKWQHNRPDREVRKRIWWCCHGQFSFLPIHAAGIYRGNHDDVCVSDFFISSYTPSLGALIDARKRPLPQHMKLLAAAQPTPGGNLKPLPDTTRELVEIASIVPREYFLYLDGSGDALDLKGDHTSVHSILEKLPEASVLHLACHGTQDVSNPVKSGFILKNGDRLTIQELIKHRVPNAYMAILSACHTASNYAEQPEEIMNLARTMMFLGFTNILGTKWPMADSDGPVVAQAVYSALFKALNSNLRNPLESFSLAKVVDNLVYDFRVNRKVPPTRWATFVHIGV